MITKDFDLDDVFLMSEIIDKMDLRLDVENALDMTNFEGKTEEQVGRELMMKVLPDLGAKVVRRLHKARREVKQFVANMTGMKESEVGKLRPKELKDFFKELVEREGFADFLADAGISIGKE